MKLINNNEGEKLSRNRKRRIVPNLKKDDEVKSLLNKIKSDEKKTFDKLKRLEIELVKIKYVINPNKIQSELKKLNRVLVVNKKLHKIKQERLRDYEGDFEMVSNLKVGDQIRQTHVKFRSFDDYESYIDSIDEGYDAEDAIFNVYIHKLSSPQFNKVNRSPYGNGCDFKHEIIEYRGRFFLPPTR